MTVVSHDEDDNSLFSRLSQLAQQGDHDYLLVDSSGVADPFQFAAYFATVDDGSPSNLDAIELDTLVTCIDAVHFKDDFMSMDSLTDRGIGRSDDDIREVAQVLLDQVEMANVLVITKADRATNDQLQSVYGILRSLNPTAKIVTASRGEVALDEVTHTGLFNVPWAIDVVEEPGDPVAQFPHDAAELGFSAIVFEARHPFHAERLASTFDTIHQFGEVYRSKGVVWIASRHDQVCDWQQFGSILGLDEVGDWAAAHPESEWPDDEELVAEIRSVWQEPWGDRRTEIVLIGRHLQETELRQALETALLTDDEMKQGPDLWVEYEDPFPVPVESCCDEEDCDCRG